MNDKPLGGKAYGSIPHLPGSRMGPGDHHCSPGQAAIATLKVRDKHDRVYVEEKLDGSCVAVARLENGTLVPLGRAGYAAVSSPYLQHRLFDAWVWKRQPLFDALLNPGERIVGEWLAQAHGTRYDLGARDPFVAFDIMRAGERAPREEFRERLDHTSLFTPASLNFGTPLSIESVMLTLGTYGYYGATERVEGAVWRVERKGVVDFLCKYVRPDKVDGCYLPRESGQAEVWNWNPGAEQ